MKTVKIKSVSAYMQAWDWCCKNLGNPGYRWYEDHPPWFGYGIAIKNAEDYVQFMLTVGADLGLDEYRTV